LTEPFPHAALQAATRVPAEFLNALGEIAPRFQAVSGAER
jgi:hypothetical protein